MLEEYFLLHIPKMESSRGVMDDIFEYFRIMKAYTAKGYLNKMIQEDKKDIDAFFEHSTSDGSANFSTSIAFNKIKWLKSLLDMIKAEEEVIFDSEMTLLDDWITHLPNLTLEKKFFLEDLEKRIMINTQNLFYFLNKH